MSPTRPPRDTTTHPSTTTEAAPPSRSGSGEHRTVDEPPGDTDHEGQAAVEWQNPDRPASNRQAIGIKFGIDPSNLYEAPDDTRSRDRAVQDLD